MGIFDEIEEQKNKSNQVTKSEVTRVTAVNSPESLGNQDNFSGNGKVTEVTGIDQLTQDVFTALSRSGLTDCDVNNLDAALFLFAWERVRDPPDAEFEEMCRQYVPIWRGRQHPIAWRILAQAIRQRLDRLKNGSHRVPNKEPSIEQEAQDG